MPLTAGWLGYEIERQALFLPLQLESPLCLGGAATQPATLGVVLLHYSQRELVVEVVLAVVKVQMLRWMQHPIAGISVPPNY